MTCTTCGKTIGSGDRYCPYCGTPVAGLANVVAAGTPSLSCPGCGHENLANSRFCASCGRQLPHGFAYAAQAAGNAQPTMPTSSSGRDPAGAAAQDERTRYLRQIDQRLADRAAVQPPAPSGDGDLADLAAAEDWFTNVHVAWERAEDELREAQSLLGLFPRAEQVAEVAELQQRRDVAWASREAAKSHRQQLWDREAWMPPPGDGDPWGER